MSSVPFEKNTAGEEVLHLLKSLFATVTYHQIAKQQAALTYAECHVKRWLQHIGAVHNRLVHGSGGIADFARPTFAVFPAGLWLQVSR